MKCTVSKFNNFSCGKFSLCSDLTSWPDFMKGNPYGCMPMPTILYSYTCHA